LECKVIKTQAAQVSSAGNFHPMHAFPMSLQRVLDAARVMMNHKTPISGSAGDDGLSVIFRRPLRQP
jgi:hypothetical protein